MTYRKNGRPDNGLLKAIHKGDTFTAVYGRYQVTAGIKEEVYAGVKHFANYI